MGGERAAGRNAAQVAWLTPASPALRRAPRDFRQRNQEAQAGWLLREQERREVKSSTPENSSVGMILRPPEEVLRFLLRRSHALVVVLQPVGDSSFQHYHSATFHASGEGAVCLPAYSQGRHLWLNTAGSDAGRGLQAAQQRAPSAV